MRHWLVTFISLVLLLASGARAEEAYFRVPLHDLKITSGAIPLMDTSAPSSWRRSPVHQPRVLLDGPGNAFARTKDDSGWSPPWSPGDPLDIVGAAPAGEPVRGVVVLPKAGGDGSVLVGFEIPADKLTANAAAKTDYFTARADHYRALRNRASVGAAWFRHEVREAEKQIDPTRTSQDERRRMGVANDLDASSTLELFSGSRAIRENLQLDREIVAPKPGEDMVDVASIKGITAAALDFDALLKGSKPDLDPLAATIPADQHAVFFPSFAAMTAMSDSLNRMGVAMGPLVPGQTSEGLKFYERQIGLEVSALSRLLGPTVIKSVAMTGSDPYFASGTDVAVIFDAMNGPTLAALLSAQISMRAQGRTEVQAVKLESPPAAGWRSPDRSMCSYLMTMGNVVAVSNSPAQLERLWKANHGESPALAASADYRFFRQRYARGDAAETALVVLSDATIRRWCSARWRLGESRRLRTAAVLAELTAAEVTSLVTEKAKAGPAATPLAEPFMGELSMSPAGPSSTIYGSLAFLTPIAETPLDKVSRAEADGYTWWRDGYERNWRGAFDPIAIRLSVADNKISSDLTVMPLILASDYTQIADLARGAKIAPDAADPHESLLHVVMALNHNSAALRTGLMMAVSQVPGLGVDPLSWLGSAVSIYIDDDPMWAEAAAKAAKDGADRQMESLLFKSPIVGWFQSTSQLKLGAFMTGLRTYVDRTAPGTTKWETLDHGDQKYVRVSSSQPQEGEPVFYYATLPEALIVSPHEGALKAAMDRAGARAAQKDKSATPAWLGESLNMKADFSRPGPIDSVMGFGAFEGSLARRNAWSAIPILNEWKRLFPDKDPVKVHMQLWHEDLGSLGGGFEWNPANRTMESRTYGSPDSPRTPADEGLRPPGIKNASVGVTLEPQGLRGKADIEFLPRK